MGARPNDSGKAEDCAAMMGVNGCDNLRGSSNTCGTWNYVGCSGGEGYEGEWHCACEYNHDRVLFIESAATLGNRGKKAKESGSNHGLFSGFAEVFAFLLSFVLRS